MKEDLLSVYGQETLVEVLGMSNNQLYYYAGEDIEKLFQRIEKRGGWPVDKRYLVVKHTVENIRPCYFCEFELRNEYNTALCSCDKYYWWKMSTSSKVSICEEMMQRLLSVLRSFKPTDEAFLAIATTAKF